MIITALQAILILIFILTLELGIGILIIKYREERKADRLSKVHYLNKSVKERKEALKNYKFVD